jgi:hypothetical protein
MGRDLYYSIPQFFEKSLYSHAMVLSWRRIDDSRNDNDFLYQICRTNGLSDIIVHASDTYIYTLTDYYQKPRQLVWGSFIYVARPEASYDRGVVEIAQKDGISIGKFGAIMGALYESQHWNYVPRERRKEK